MKNLSACIALAVVAAVAPASTLASPTLHGVAQAATSSSASEIAMDRPPGVLAGDVMIAVVDARLPASGSITAPAGWYSIRREGTAGSTGTALSQALYYRVAGQLEPSAYTWQFARKTGVAGAVLAYGGVDPTAPIADDAGSMQSNVTTIVAPSVTTTQPGDGLLALFGTAEANAITPPSGMIERHETTGAGNRVASSESADAVVSTAGASGDRTATSDTTAPRAVGQLVALRALTATPPPPPPPPPGGLSLQPVDGGPSYYGQFANPLSDAPSFFPLAAWGTYDHRGTTNGVRNIDLDAQAGLNTYIWVADACNQIPFIRADGRFRVIYAQSENRTCKGSESSGWFLADEIDMTCGPSPGCYDQLQSIVNGLPNDGQLRYNNYGKGVLLWQSDTDAARWINGKTGGNTFQQITASDLYWLTDPNERGGSRYGFASSYGDDITKERRLDALDGKRQPIWAVVETGWPFTESAAQGDRAIQPDELRAAAWHTLIAGARGINYFVHSFGGPHAGDHNTLRSNSEGTRPETSAVNAQIKALAPVLNAPFVSSGHSATDTMNGTVRYMLKWSGGKFYLFAGADRGGGSATFSIPCLGTATATRLAPTNRPGEAATIPVSNGQWSDQFADKNAVHIYRIDGGTTCGL
jgi:hypothetical protein